MTLPVLNLSSLIECPKCSKNTVISRQEDMYQCLNCDFERNLKVESTGKTQGKPGELIFAVIGFLVTLALIL